MSKTRKRKIVSGNLLSINRKKKQEKKTRKGLSRIKRQAERASLGYCEPPEKKININKIRLSEAENQACWNWAKEVTKQRKFPTAWQQKRVHCSKCGQNYCLGGNEVDTYCSSCYYMENKNKPTPPGVCFSGCQKEYTGERVCQRCSK